jgi:hypothetical protein
LTRLEILNTRSFYQARFEYHLVFMLAWICQITWLSRTTSKLLYKCTDNCLKWIHMRFLSMNCLFSLITEIIIILNLTKIFPCTYSFFKLKLVRIKIEATLI